MNKFLNWIKCLLGRHARRCMVLTERGYGEDRLFTLVYCPHCCRIVLIARTNPEPAPPAQTSPSLAPELLNNAGGRAGA